MSSPICSTLLATVFKFNEEFPSACIYPVLGIVELVRSTRLLHTCPVVLNIPELSAGRSPLFLNLSNHHLPGSHGSFCVPLPGGLKRSAKCLALSNWRGISTSTGKLGRGWLSLTCLSSCGLKPGGLTTHARRKAHTFSSCFW